MIHRRTGRPAETLEEKLDCLPRILHSEVDRLTDEWDDLEKLRIFHEELNHDINKLTIELYSTFNDVRDLYIQNLEKLKSQERATRLRIRILEL